MTDALKMYEGVKIELDQYQSPSFDVQDFNFFLPKAVEHCVKKELDGFELTQKVTDKLAPLIKISDPLLIFNADNTTDVREKELPADYRHVVSSLVRLRYKTATTAFTAGTKRSSFSRRLTGDLWAFVMEDYYLRPLVSDADVRLYHRVIGNKLSILIDTPVYPETTVVIEDVKLEYISQPPVIKLNNNLTIAVDTVFPVHFNQEIVTTCARLFLENNESSRQQTIAEVNN